MAFAAAAIMTSLAGGTLTAHAVGGPAPASTSNLLTIHGSNCKQSAGTGATVFSNGMKNINVSPDTGNVTLVCPLPVDGSIAHGYSSTALITAVDVYDGNPSSGGAIGAQSCYTNRGVAGGTCSLMGKTNSTDSFVGYASFNLPTPAADTTQSDGSTEDLDAARYLLVFLPPQRNPAVANSAAFSVLRSYGLGALGVTIL